MRRLATLFLAVGVACGATDDGDGAGDDDLGGDLPVGALDEADAKADGDWGAALTCKDIPALPALPSPQITVSIDGQTLRLFDRTTGFDKTFPIGVGGIEDDDASVAYGESRSMWPVLAYGKADFVIKKSGRTACKTWWTDAATGEKLPVFAGLPFLSWSGNYGIHGPIDGYRNANGGTLRRGYVSHGCLRMEAADVLEVYARTNGAAAVPVHVQREPERTAAGVRVDVTPRWIGSECTVDADCGFAGGECRVNPIGGRKFCSQRCTATCPDRANQPTTFCVADAERPGSGLCVPRQIAQNQGCRSYDHFVPRTAARFNRPAVTTTVCAPGAPGWIGDRCRADGDCQAGNRCSAGVCTQACQSLCPDAPGYATTTCVTDAKLGAGGQCARTCSLTDNGASCAAGLMCAARPKLGGTGTRNDCVPKA